MKPLQLTKWRERHDLSRKNLAEALGVAEVTIYRWEKAMRKIPPFLHLALGYLESEGKRKIGKS